MAHHGKDAHPGAYHNINFDRHGASCQVSQPLHRCWSFTLHASVTSILLVTNYDSLRDYSYCSGCYTTIQILNKVKKCIQLKTKLVLLLLLLLRHVCGKFSWTFRYIFDLGVPLGPLGTSWTCRYLLDLYVPLGPLGTSCTFRYRLNLQVPLGPLGTFELSVKFLTVDVFLIVRKFLMESPPITQGLGQRPKEDWPMAKKALAKGKTSPKELEVSFCSGLYLLVM